MFTSWSLFFLLPLFLLWYYLHIPWNMPRNLPRIPIYVSLLGLWSSMGQDEIYARWLRQPLETHGAVLIWFAGRWSVLVTRPELLSEIFRHEDLYAKAGSQVKIPWSVIASLVGDNVINSHGEHWKLYTRIMKPGMQRRDFDVRPMREKSRKLVDLLLREQGRYGKVLVNSWVQKFSVDVMGEGFLDLDFQSLDHPVRIEELQSIIKRTLFKPLFFNFPGLDKHTWLFPSRKKAYAIMKEFEDTLYHMVRNNPRKQLRKKGLLDGSSSNMVSTMLEDALDAGKITDQQFRDNIKITFLTAHENVQQLLNSTFWELGRNVHIQTTLRSEILSTNTSTPTASTVNQLPYLTSVIYELLRLYPPVSQLINRVTLQPAMLGGTIPIPAGTWVGWNAYGVQTDPQVWGPTAEEFRPERWGTTVEEMQARVRRETVRGAYIPFNAHSRKCLGQGFALLEMKIVLFELLRRVEWRVEEGYRLKLTSGGILAPLGCHVILKEI